MVGLLCASARSVVDARVEPALAAKNPTARKRWLATMA
jgi:hypothetical protein